MRTVKRLSIAVIAYVGIVVAFESLVVTMGKRQADRGLRPDETWLVITTTDALGSKDTVVAGVESDGHLYVAANHWPRRWYNRAVENPDVVIARAGQKIDYRAVPVSGPELVRIAQDYSVPWVIRLLTGFPPRSFLRLDARPPPERLAPRLQREKREEIERGGPTSRGFPAPIHRNGTATKHSWKPMQAAASPVASRKKRPLRYTHDSIAA
jgi:hypothetical protein